MGLPINVLVTAVGGQSVGHQILQALALAGDRYRVVATDVSDFAYGLYQAKTRYLLPPAASPEYLGTVERLIQRENISAILPGSQPETNLLAANADRFGKCGVIVNPRSVVDICQNKQVLVEWLHEAGFAAPRSLAGTEWQRAVREYGFPLVIKPTQESGGSRGADILKDEAELHSYLGRIPPENVQIQEYVGDLTTEYTVGVMVSREGEVIDSIVIHRHLAGMSLGLTRKIDGKLYGLSTGYSQGTIVRHEQIQRTCEALALRIGARGPLNIQLRMHGDKVMIFEVHPRFSGTSSIRALAGFNEPDTLIRNFLYGEKFGRISYQTDVMAIRALSNQLVPVKTMREVPRA